MGVHRAGLCDDLRKGVRGEVSMLSREGLGILRHNSRGTRLYRMQNYSYAEPRVCVAWPSVSLYESVFESLVVCIPFAM